MPSLTPAADPTPVQIFVDPTCPWAWVTFRWLAEVADAGRIDLDVGLVSLPALNEGRDLDPDYRAKIDRAWFPSRVALAVLTAEGPAGLRAFYEAFGQRRHVESAPQAPETVVAALAQAGLPGSLADAGDDPGWDDQLRALTTRAVDLVENPEVGTPIVYLGGRGFFGPVLARIPRGAEAVRLFDALFALADYPDFAELKRGRPTGPITS